MDENKLDLNELCKELDKFHDLKGRLELDTIEGSKIKYFIDIANEFTGKLVSFVYKNKNTENFILELNIIDYLTDIPEKVELIKKYNPSFSYPTENIYRNIKNINRLLEENKKEEKIYKKDPVQQHFPYEDMYGNTVLRA